MCLLPTRARFLMCIEPRTIGLAFEKRKSFIVRSAGKERAGKAVKSGSSPQGWRRNLRGSRNQLIVPSRISPYELLMLLEAMVSFFLGRAEYIALQCGVCFRHRTEWMRYMYTYIPLLFSLPPTPTSHLSRSSQSAKLSSQCYIAASH